MRKFTYTIYAFVMAFAPQLAAAQQVGSFKDLVKLIMRFVQLGISILMALLAMGSIYLAFLYINETRTGGKNVAAIRERMIWAVIGTAVSFSLWGLVSVVTSSFGVSNIGIVQFQAP